VRSTGRLFLNMPERTPEDMCTLSKEFLLPNIQSMLNSIHSHVAEIFTTDKRFKSLKKITNTFNTAISQQCIHYIKGPTLRGLVLPAADAYDPALFGHMVNMNIYRGWLAASFFFLVDKLRGFLNLSLFLSPPITLQIGWGPC
jgi:hypothetical protein